MNPTIKILRNLAFHPPSWIAVMLLLCLMVSALGPDGPWLSRAWARPDATEVTIVPKPATVVRGRETIVTVMVKDVVDLYGVDVVITFNPALVEVVSMTPLSSFLKGPGFPIVNFFDNTAGTIHYAMTQLNPAEPASGSGAILEIKFEGEVVGATALTFTYGKMTTRDGTPIPATYVNGSLEVEVNPTDVILASFDGSPFWNGAALNWQTANELSLAGFNLYRSETQNGERVPVATGIEPQMPGTIEGASYQWFDPGLIPFKTYYYWLEVLLTDGSSDIVDPVSVTARPAIFLPLISH